MLIQMVRQAQSGMRQRQKEQTRQALLSAARKILAQRGLAETTTREIAREAGVAAGTFFVHFPDVSALVDALLDEHVQHALERALSTAPTRAGLVAELVHVCKTLFESYAERPELSRAYIEGSLFRQRSGEMSARLAGFQRWVIERIDSAVTRGDVPEIDRELAFMSFFSLYFGVLVAGLNGLMPRERQLSLLEAALSRLFLLERAT
jgi:AcrR family transcriptional regulator